MIDFIYIPMNVPSSKNSKQLFKNFKTDKNFITESEVSKKYRRNTAIYWNKYRKYFHQMIEGKSKPYVIEFTFIRTDSRRWDFHNMVQLPLDIMSASGWIEDDDVKNVLVVPPLPPKESHKVDKERSGLEIRVI